VQLLDGVRRDLGERDGESVTPSCSTHIHASVVEGDFQLPDGVCFALSRSGLCRNVLSGPLERTERDPKLPHLDANYSD